MKPVLEVRSVWKRYGEAWALRGVSLAVARGECLALVGPNGAGKTTLLRIMAMLDSPTSGELYYNGSRVIEMDKHRSGITMVFQTPVFFSGTVEDNVGFGLRLRKKDEQTIKREVRKALELVNLQGFEDRDVRNLSTGEKQRVALARALCLKPDVLLLDEPTANLDPPNCKIIEEVLETIKGESTVVIASHHLALAKKVADRVAFIHNGKLIELGSKDEIFARPKNEMTRKFISGELV
jgi:tungstate transport system ATP-binding protein